MMKFLVSLFTVFVIAITSLAIYMINCPNKLTEEKGIVLAKGVSVRRLSEDLQEARVINSSLLFRLVVRGLGIDKKLQAGEYMFPPKVNMMQIAKQLQNGEVYYRRITLNEGWTSAQMIDFINNEPNLTGDISIKTEEGSMLPETYSFSKGDSRNSIVKQAQKAMEKVLDDAWKNNSVSVLKSKNELLVLASIIEKETGLPEERSDVAAVFVNRLNKRMRLQTDPTVIYAITLGKRSLGRSLLKKDLEYDSPYNTYKNYGLPPAPICNPGKEAIYAAANPSSADYLYFVAKGNGGHRFAKTLSEHNDNVALYRKFLKNK